MRAAGCTYGRTWLLKAADDVGPAHRCVCECICARVCRPGSGGAEARRLSEAVTFRWKHLSACKQALSPQCIPSQP
ncbi:hypothetical protein JOB18_031203 [Solea senegalensis]|uniref:Uncharacterized protein n=1 Tax=Solea senegalensis TaxID=28829 RepID=A0AAV6SMP6_SOLSE|nr:hypothetical protein JOB18_031203 [Solea senegalensis]